MHRNGRAGPGGFGARVNSLAPCRPGKQFPRTMHPILATVRRRTQGAMNFPGEMDTLESNRIYSNPYRRRSPLTQ